MKDSRIQSAIMDWDDMGDRSLMEWQEGEEPDRVRKRKRKQYKRSRRQSGVTPNNITNIPPERKKRVGDKYLLVGAPRTKVNINHPRMAALDHRIQKAALVIEEISAIRARERKLQ